MVIPALVDGDGPVLLQSLAIIEYLDETHPRPPLLPRGARGGARVRALSQIVTCDSHPLIVPRVREYLEHEFKLDEPTRIKWASIGTGGSDGARTERVECERNRALLPGRSVTIADICVASQAAGADFFNVDLAPFPTFARHRRELRRDDAFARAHPLRQPGAPAAA